MNKYIIFILSALLLTTQINAKGCVFCKTEIIKDQSIYESEYFSVVLDYEPRVPGHLLVIPKRHVAKAHELSQNEWAEMSNIISKTAKVFSEFLATDDYIIVEKNGRNAFQQVPHVHFHLFPVHSEAWGEIFDIVPDQLDREELERQIGLFRNYFNYNTSAPIKSAAYVDKLN